MRVRPSVRSFLGGVVLYSLPNTHSMPLFSRRCRAFTIRLGRVDWPPNPFAMNMDVAVGPSRAHRCGSQEVEIDLGLGLRRM